MGSSAKIIFCVALGLLNFCVYTVPYLHWELVLNPEYSQLVFENKLGGGGGTNCVTLSL